ncbi:hypothetical protein [Niabella hibiscisoli]|uniref:hypothetical protein n=1 Tax=Niabella hibiscisoli TaxID=1825928 RepID=UPI001F114374|nr:hypothetical protein [Niabella hibiscisoli]MCH5714911.1 hypothetical protein [Niabella hibiscisoli]
MNKEIWFSHSCAVNANSHICYIRLKLGYTMFDILAQYLFQFRRLVLPPIGRFELESKEANANPATSTIASPSWIVGFEPYDEDVELKDNIVLVNWLVDKEKISAEQARNSLVLFVTDLQNRLNNGDRIDWPSLGTLEKKNNQVQFKPILTEISPFTDVAAKKVTREHTSYQTVVGDKQTTTAQMREQLQLPDEKEGKVLPSCG